MASITISCLPSPCFTNQPSSSPNHFPITTITIPATTMPEPRLHCQNHISKSNPPSPISLHHSNATHTPQFITMESQFQTSARASLRPHPRDVYLQTSINSIQCFLCNSTIPAAKTTQPLLSKTTDGLSQSTAAMNTNCCNHRRPPGRVAQTVKAQTTA
jgi:hypothetical protein